MAFTEDEIRIIQERRAARAARAAREAAGLPEELEPPQKRSFARRLARSKMLLIVVIGGLMGLVAYLLWHSETLLP